jgi:hypothetical protein
MERRVTPSTGQRAQITASPWVFLLVAPVIALVVVGLALAAAVLLGVAVVAAFVAALYRSMPQRWRAYRARKTGVYTITTIGRHDAR